MLDEYLFGRADRLSPEKPVPVVAFERRELFPGGAGNVVRNLGALGCEPVLIALVGDDEAGRECRARLEEEGRLMRETLYDNEAFVDAVARGVQAAIRTGQQEKRAALRNAALNAALNLVPDEAERQMFLELVERFTVLAPANPQGVSGPG